MQMDTTMLDLAERQAARCRTFGNARRIMILWIISKGELSVNEIAERAGSSLQNISQHLSLLKKSGFVSTRRNGQTIYYRLTDQECLKVCPFLPGMPDTLEYTVPRNHK
jgi:ArsR family transcriptional regulator, virulence genes transcriptional regulator